MTLLCPPFLQPLSEARLKPLCRFLGSAPPVSQYRPSILLGYSRWEKPRLRLENDLLLVENQGSAELCLYAAGPGPLSRQACAQILHWLRQHPNGRALVAEACLPPTEHWGTTHQVREVPAMHNYLLSVHHMLEGDSPGMRRKQRVRAQFQQLYPEAHIQRLDPACRVQAELVARFFQRLAAECPNPAPDFARDTEAFLACLQRAEAWGVELHAVVTPGELLGIQAFEYPRGSCYFSSYCRTLKAIPHLYDYFDIAMAEQARRRGYTCYNIGEDLGLPNVRRGKQGWEPMRMLRLFEIFNPRATAE